MILYYIYCKVRKFDDLKKYVGRVIALDVNMVNFNKILTSFKNVIFYVYFDMNFPEKLYNMFLGSFKVSLMIFLHEFINKI